MCDLSVYRDPLPDVIDAALRSAGVRPSFRALSTKGTHLIEVVTHEDRMRAFKALSAAIPDDKNWRLLHVSAPFHLYCMNCAGEKRP